MTILVFDSSAGKNPDPSWVIARSIFITKRETRHVQKNWRAKEYIKHDKIMRTYLQFCHDSFYHFVMIVSKLGHPSVLRASLVLSRLTIIRAARFCRRCNLLLHSTDNSPQAVSV